MKETIKLTVLGCLLLALLLWIPSCAVNPVSGKQELMLMSERDEMKLGSETDLQIVQQYGIYENPKLNAYLHDLCQRLGKISHRSQLTYRLKILDTPVVNAFAVPGGHVYFTRGILATVNSEAELAGLMGHEIGHITARHSAQQYSKAQLAQWGLGVGAIIIDSSILTGLAQVGVGLLFMRFSRDNEREADDLGVEYSSKAGYDATQMAHFFETLERINPGSDRSGLPGWFSTHPSPENRVQAVRIRAKEWQQKLNHKDLIVHRDSYLKQIDGLLFGEDPRQGYLAENIFYHPVYRFQFPIPVNWKVSHRSSKVQMVNEGQDAVILFSVEEAFSSSREASETFITAKRASVIRSDSVLVNGLSSRRTISDIQTQKQVLRVMSTFIEKDKKVFVFHGLASRSLYPKVETSFEHSMRQFKELSDSRRIDVRPERIRIRTTRDSDTMENALRSFGVQNEKLKEIALLNGAALHQIIPASTLIKVVEKGQ